MRRTKTELAGDFLDGVAAFEKRPNLIEQFLPNGQAAAGHQALLGDCVRWTNRSCGERRRRLTASLFDLRLRDRRFKEAKLPLDGLAEVLHQMKAVSDLPRLWRALTRGLRIETSTVAADHFHLRMALQPTGGRFRRTIRQQVHNPPTLQVHDDRAVAGAFAPRPVINASHADRTADGARFCMSFQAA
jgi:hypothetical protein